LISRQVKNYIYYSPALHMIVRLACKRTVEWRQKCWWAAVSKLYTCLPKKSWNIW